MTKYGLSREQMTYVRLASYHSSIPLYPGGKPMDGNPASAGFGVKAMEEKRDKFGRWRGINGLDPQYLGLFLYYARTYSDYTCNDIPSCLKSPKGASLNINVSASDSINGYIIINRHTGETGVLLDCYYDASAGVLVMHYLGYSANGWIQFMSGTPSGWATCDALSPTA